MLPAMIRFLPGLLLVTAAVAKDAPEPEAVVTVHEVVVGKEPIAYEATAGTLPLRAGDGKVRARVFHVAYARKGADPKTRPVTFVFNGGPGSSSVWLHLGALGPRRVRLDDEGEPLRPPGKLVDNDESWLDLTDLVFIDPIGTGYSRPAEGVKQSEFSGLREDTDSVADFIRLWTTRNGRWASPKYLAGESYGTTRAASLSGRLQDRYGMYLNGIVLVSAVLNFQTIRYGTGNDLPYALYLPGYAATAWYHGRLEGDELAAILREVEEFALSDYLTALAQGDALPAERRAEIARRVARYTGLSAAFVEASNLRIRLGRFAKELLRDRRRTVGRLDGRYLGIDRDSAGSSYEYDPSMAAIVGPFSAAFKDYVRTELRYESDAPYDVMGRVGRWRFPEGRYVEVAETLRRAMTKNRKLKVLVASGYYDLATPYFAADYTVRHLGLDPALRGNVRVRHYEAGHMMYVRKESRRKLKRDVAAFYAWHPGESAAAR